MAEVVSAFQRPSSMSASQLQGRVTHFTLTHQSRLTMCGSDPSDGLRLRIETDDDTVGTGKREFSGPMTGLRWLGLRPAFVPSGV